MRIYRQFEIAECDAFHVDQTLQLDFSLVADASISYDILTFLWRLAALFINLFLEIGIK